MIRSFTDHSDDELTRIATEPEAESETPAAELEEPPAAAAPTPAAGGGGGGGGKKKGNKKK